MRLSTSLRNMLNTVVDTRGASPSPSPRWKQIQAFVPSFQADSFQKEHKKENKTSKICNKASKLDAKLQSWEQIIEFEENFKKLIDYLIFN